jgi:outer membrane protein assembly factor BamB
MLFPRLFSCLFPLVVLFISQTGCSKGPPRNAVAVTEVKKDSTAIEESSPIRLADSDWPQWRGPNGNGSAGKQRIPTLWDESTNILWKSSVPGRGHASPVVVGNAVFLATAIADSQQQMVVAFDRTSGDQLWQTVVHAGGFPDQSEIHQKGSNANSTLVSDGDRLFAVFLNAGRVFATALDTNGKQLWQSEVGPFSSKFGYAPSPVLYKSTIIIAADNWGGGYLAAVNRMNGDIVWRRKRPAVSTYSSPLVARISGRDQLVISGCDLLASFDPATGDDLWSCTAIAEATCGTPVTDGAVIFASGGYPDRQTIAVKGDGSGQTIWSNSTKIYEPSLVVSGKQVFAVADDGIVWCWSADNGNVLWKKRLEGSFSASPIVCDGSVFVPSTSGETYIFRASGEGYHEIARNRLGDDTFASIAVSGSDIFLRVGYADGNDRHEKLVCVRAK